MAEELNALRDKIDAVDKQLIDLLAARLALVGKWGSEEPARPAHLCTGSGGEHAGPPPRRGRGTGVPGTLSRMCCAG